MRRPILGILLLVLVSGVALRAGDNTKPNSPTTSAPAILGEQIIAVDSAGVLRQFILHVPASYTPDSPIPLVLFYHGGGGDMNQAKSYNFQSKAEEAGFAVAFLNGSSAFRGGRLATWNAGNCCAYARDNAIDDVAFTRAVIADVTGRISVDTDKIFATGMSNGGMMVHKLACEMADVFAAVASVTGTDGTESCNPSQPISVLHIHALDDTHVLFNGGAGEGAFRNKDTVADFVSVPETINRWVTRNNLLNSPTRTLSVSGAYCDTYTGTTNDSSVMLCVTETGEHSWPGSAVGADFRDKNPSQAIVANDVIWEFFSANGR